MTDVQLREVSSLLVSSEIRDASQVQLLLLKKMRGDDESVSFSRNSLIELLGFSETAASAASEAFSAGEKDPAMIFRAMKKALSKTPVPERTEFEFGLLSMFVAIAFFITCLGIVYGIVFQTVSETVKIRWVRLVPILLVPILLIAVLAISLKPDTYALHLADDVPPAKKIPTAAEIENLLQKDCMFLCPDTAFEVADGGIGVAPRDDRESKAPIVIRRERKKVNPNIVASLVTCGVCYLVMLGIVAYPQIQE